MNKVPEGFIMPDFGPQPGAAARADATSGDAPAQAVSTGPRKMAFICSKGNVDMAYPALIMGNAALSEGVEVHIFFTFLGARHRQQEDQRQAAVHDGR